MSEQPQQPPQPGYGYPQDGQPQGSYSPPQGGHPGAYPPPPGAYPSQGSHPGAYPPPGYPGAYPPPPGYFTGDPNAPYGYDPYGRPLSDKSKIVAGVLQFVLGGFGAGRFYLGNVGLGLAQLFTCGGLGIWALIDGIILLTGNDNTDAQGRILRG